MRLHIARSDCTVSTVKCGLLLGRRRGSVCETSASSAKPGERLHCIARMTRVRHSDLHLSVTGWLWSSWRATVLEAQTTGSALHCTYFQIPGAPKLVLSRVPDERRTGCIFQPDKRAERIPRPGTRRKRESERAPLKELCATSPC